MRERALIEELVTEYKWGRKKAAIVNTIGSMVKSLIPTI